MPAGFLDRADRLLKALLEALIAGIVASLVMVCFVEVMLRYGFGRGLGWYDEFAGYLLVWLTFLGSALAQREERHIGLESLPARLGPAARRWTKLLEHLLLALIQLVLLYYGTLLALRFHGEQAITLPVPMGFLYAVIPVSALAILLIQLTQVRRWLQPPDEADRRSEAG
jgi:TRAP-type C4-dicarboxylate transport system permease small subunit